MAKETIVTAIDTSTGKAGKSVTLKPGQNDEDLDVLPSEEEVTVKESKKEVKKDELDLEIVDDTPEADRGRKPLKKEAIVPAKEEIEQYDEKVQERINKLTHGYHDERRAKEAAARERDEAVKLAKTLYQETQRLKKAGAVSETNAIKEMKEKAAAQLEAAKKALKEAYAEEDVEKIAAAQEAISQATINREIAARTKVPDEVKEVSVEELDKQVDSRVQSKSQAEQAPPEDPRAKEWTEKNSKWFGENRMMTSFALGVHQDLIEKGVHPIRDADKYYSRINSLMREKFPEYEWGDETKPSARKSEPKSATVVAPVQRTTKGTKVTLTTSQVALARRLGLTPEQYARELVKQMETQ